MCDLTIIVKDELKESSISLVEFLVKDNVNKHNDLYETMIVKVEMNIKDYLKKINMFAIQEFADCIIINDNVMTEETNVFFEEIIKSYLINEYKTTKKVFILPLESKEFNGFLSK
jgi:hypothetical protein